MNIDIEKELSLLTNEEIVVLYENILGHLKFLDASILNLESEGNVDG